MSFIRAIKEWHQELKYRRQRAKRGWSVKDTWSIDYWFLDVMPKMLEYLKEHHIGFPSEIQKEYFEAHSDELNMTYEEYCSWPADENSEGYKLREKTDEICNNLWNEILDRMIFLLREASEESCSIKNPYEEENEKNYKEFTKKYGILGEKLLKPEDIYPNGEKRLYSPSDIPEYKETSELYLKESIKLDEYRDRCKTEAINLFNRWFWNLWD